MDDETLLDVAVKLLSVESTADRPDELGRALDLVLDVIGGGFEVARFSSNGRPSVLVHRPGPRPRFRVILNGHLDVVPGAPEQFRPRRDGDRLYARGAQDMKVSALVQAVVFAELADSLPYPLALQLVTDEEVGGYHGTGYQVREGVRGDFVVIGEQSRLDLTVESKGILGVALRAEGRAGHGAYPWLGDSATLKLLRTLDRFVERYPQPSAEAWRTTLNVAAFGTDNRAVNQIPADAWARLDIRFPPEDTDLTGRECAEVVEFLTGLCEPGVGVELEQYDPPHLADRGRPEVALLREAARAEGYPAEFLRKHGAADGRFYSACGIDAVIFGVGGDGQHGPEEYVDVTTVAPYRRALRRFLTSLPAE